MSSRPVLISTRADDATADLVIAALHERAVPVVRFDPGMDFPSSVAMSGVLGQEGWSGPLRVGDRIAELSEVRSFYHRRPSHYAAEHLTGQDAEFTLQENRRGLGGVLHSLPDCLYVNHPLDVARTEYKPLQLSLAARLRFDVPATLITNDPQAARDFAKEHAPVVYKPLHAGAYAIGEQPACIWVKTIDADEIGQNVAGAAHLFRARVAKVADWRVTVVGGQVFCARITSPDGVTDWRSAYSDLTYEAVPCPSELHARIRKFMAALGLVFGAFDFAEAADGRLWFLELNPNGQWAWLEPAARLPITAALADLLAQGMNK